VPKGKFSGEEAMSLLEEECVSMPLHQLTGRDAGAERHPLEPPPRNHGLDVRQVDPALVQQQFRVDV